MELYYPTDYTSRMRLMLVHAEVVTKGFVEPEISCVAIVLQNTEITQKIPCSPFFSMFKGPFLQNLNLNGQNKFLFERGHFQRNAIQILV